MRNAWPRALSSCGSRSRTRRASSWAIAISSAWAARSARRRVGKPLCRVPSTSPAPRSSQILLGDAEAVLGLAQDREPLPRRLAQRRLVEQQAGRGLVAAPDAAAQLVQLGEAEALGVLDDHDRRGGHIDADLDHRRRHQEVDRRRRRSRPWPGPSRRSSCGRGPARRGRAPNAASAPYGARRRRRDRCPRIPRPAGRSSRPWRRCANGAARPRRRPRPGARAARCGCRSAGGPAASRSGARRRDRHRRSSSGCAGSAWRSSAGCRRRLPLSASARRCSTPKRCCSSMTASARSRKTTSCCNRAWVPTTIGVSARGEAGQDRVARPAPFSRPVKKPISTPAGRGQPAQGRLMLAGEDLGRRHQRGLRAALDRAQHRQQRDHGLAAADIALQQPHHACGAAPCRRSISASACAARRSAQSRAPASTLAAQRTPVPTIARPAPALAAGAHQAPPRAGWRATRHRRAARAPACAGDRSASLAGAWTGAARRPSPASRAPAQRGIDPFRQIREPVERRRHRPLHQARGVRPAVSG